MGGVSASLRISSFSTKTSTAPVLSFAFSIPFFLGLTIPLTEMTSSLPSLSATLWESLLKEGSKTTWVMPYLSLKSMKIPPPWSLLVEHQPHRTAFLLTSFSANSPQVCVLFIMKRIYRRYLKLLEIVLMIPFHGNVVHYFL